MKKTFLRVAVLFLIGLTSCLDDPDCITSTTDFVNIRFYQKENRETDTLAINSVTIPGVDSVLLSDPAFRGTLRVPLDPLSDSAIINFDTELGQDTLVLVYQTSTRLVSEDCGLEILFSDVNYSRNDFDSIAIVNNILIEEINEDIRIFN